MRIEEDVRVIVEVDTPKGLYRDALYFAPGEVPAEPVIEATAQARADAWVELLNAPPPEDPPAEFDVTTEDGTVVPA